jgi:serine/threonine-protein kinase
MEQATGSQTPAAGIKNSPDRDGTVDLTGQTLGDFKILRSLGEGGMGQVYLAEQKSLNRKVALKVLRADLAANKTALARFDAEAKAVAQATHANIVQVYAINEENGLHYMALEYVEGRNLRQYLEKKGPPELMLAISIIRQVAAAIQRASELGIIHRDIKPENILLTRKGEVKVADFGLSRIYDNDRQPLNLTQSGVTMGTPLYMSPEQVEGKPVDPRTDIYSFGVTCYHLLAGHPPFRGETPFEVAIQHVQKDPVPLAQIRPDLPAELCDLVHKMMAKNPDERIQTGREIVRELVRLRDSLIGASGSGGQPTHIVQTGPVASDPEFDAVLTQSLPLPTPRRRWLSWLAVGSVFLALAGGLAYGWWQVRDRPAPQVTPGTSVQARPNPLQDVPAPAAKTPAGPSKEEQELLDAIKKHESGPTDLKQALKSHIDLGVYYVRVARLDEAKDVFKKLEDQDVKKWPGFKVAGRAGRAIVLAFRDDYKESNKLFVNLFTVKPGGSKVPMGPYPPWWQSNPALAEMAGLALDRNHANAPAEFPAVLEKYRTPPGPRKRR